MAMAATDIVAATATGADMPTVAADMEPADAASTQAAWVADMQAAA
jgi:hypothetical protein